MDVGDQIRKLRRNRGLKQRELADIIGVSRSTIVLYEQSKRNPTLEYLSRIADYFGVPVDYFVSAVPPPAKSDARRWEEVTDKANEIGVTPEHVMRFLSTIEEVYDQKK